MTRYTAGMLRLVLVFAAVMLVAGMSTMFVLRRAVPGGAAAASGPEVRNVKDLLPYQGLYSKEEIRADFDLQRITPFGEPKFYFEMLVPKTFEPHSITVSKQQLVMDAQVPVPMAEMGPKGRDDVILEVRYLRVPPRVTLEKFIEVFARQSGYTIVAQQRGEFNGRLVQDVLVRMVTPQFGAVLTRVTASRKGDIIYMVGGSAKEADYPRWKKIFGAAALTFDADATPAK